MAKPTIPMLQRKQGNPNQISFIVHSGASLLKPIPGSLVIKLEIRRVDAGLVLASPALTLLDDTSGLMSVSLPDLAQFSSYYLSLFFDYATLADFRVGVARLQILPQGSLTDVTTNDNLNLTINQVQEVLTINLSTPAYAVKTGDMRYVNSTQQYYNGVSWVNVPNQTAPPNPGTNASFPYTFPLILA